jgi:ammonia channel protein AmtB
VYVHLFNSIAVDTGSLARFQGVIHPLIARLIWSDKCTSLSPYRFCTDFNNFTTSYACNYGCNEALSLHQRMYVLDFAGGGAVHMLGGIAGLVISLLAKLQEYRDRGREGKPITRPLQQRAGSSVALEEAEDEEEVPRRSFLEWMYPVSGGEESVSDAALGVVILWFCWFAFNCGSTESVQVGVEETSMLPRDSTYYPYYGIPSTIAVNMIMAAASGGIVAVVIAVWAQTRSRSDSVNANEIANGILSALVGITAGCAFVDYWAACIIGAMSVVLYHLGCFAEYKLKLKDTARVVPVHAVCGLWSLLAIGIFQAGDPARCNLHAAFEGLCYCHLRLPQLSQGEIFLSQLCGALIMIGISFVSCSILYGLLYIIPMQPFVWLAEKVFFLTPKNTPPLRYRGGWLFTSPEDRCVPSGGGMFPRPILPDTDSTDGAPGVSVQRSGWEVRGRGGGSGGQYGSLEAVRGGVVNGGSGIGSGGRGGGKARRTPRSSNSSNSRQKVEGDKNIE